MEEATYLALGLIFIEILWRMSICNVDYEFIYTTGFEPFVWWIVAYVLCILCILFDVKHIAFFQSPSVRNILKLLHACDGLIVVVIGAAYYFENNLFLAIGVLCITKFFLLHLLSRMVTGVKAFSRKAIILQTTKTFLHHTASFYFLNSGSCARLTNTLLLTTVWRAVSMTGHAALTLRHHGGEDGWEPIALSEKSYDQLIWTISHARNAIVAFILAMCYMDEQFRRGFGISAVGHVAYMIVRALPVFRIASQYFPNPTEREQWENLTDGERLKKLLSGEHPWLLLELGGMLVCSVVFLYYRITMLPVIDYDTCNFS